jgi:hypothetical protein
MPNDCTCLPCTLKRALDGWQSTHFLSTEALMDQLGVFVIREITKRPEFKGRTLGLAIMEDRDGVIERLH